MQTDHKPLLTIFGSKKGQPVYTANRLLRWGTILLNYNFKLEYLPSRQIGLADGLSRLVPSQSEPLEDSVIASLITLAVIILITLILFLIAKRPSFISNKGKVMFELNAKKHGTGTAAFLCF